VSPFRWDVLITGFVLGIPVLGLGLRGDFTAEEVLVRLVWCLGAGWAAVAVIRYASTPRPPTAPAVGRAVPAAAPAPAPAPAAEDDERAADGEPATT
jgi:hypothetical protein